MQKKIAFSPKITFIDKQIVKKKERTSLCVDIWNGTQELSFIFHKIVYQIISIHSPFSDRTQQARGTGNPHG